MLVHGRGFQFFNQTKTQPTLRWVVWIGKGYQPFELPAVGESRLLPPVCQALSLLVSRSRLASAA